MKKLLFLLFLAICIPTFVSAKEIKVTLNKCVDGDTAYFNHQDKIMKVRFLAIDTPETKHPTKQVENYGSEASSYTCKRLTTANSIILKSDSNASKDKYGRYLFWVFTDGDLLQEQLVNKGYAKVAYLYDEYLYTDLLLEGQAKAQNQKLGIWGDSKPPNFYSEVIVTLIFLLLLWFFNKKLFHKNIKKMKKQMIKNLKKKH